MLSNLLVGEQRSGDGQIVVNRGGNMGDVIASDLQGRFYEMNLRNRLFAFGLSNTALVSANAIATGLTATAQPVIAVYNAMGSGVNVVILQAILHETTLANSAVASGGYMWVYSVGNAAISTGSNPISLKTLSSPGGSASKAYAVSTALTGLSNNLAVLRASAFYGINAAGPATAITQPQGPGVENVDGGIIVPPGGVVGIMDQVSTTTISVNVGLIWAEVPLP